MRAFKVWALLVSVALAASFCTAAVFAESSSVTHSGSASIEFRRPTKPPSSGGGGGGGGSSGGRGQGQDTDLPRTKVIQDSAVPTDTVTILDSKQPLAALPKTGGETLVPTLLILLGTGCLFSAIRGERQRGRAT